jgi:3-hydroxyacyl-[acyl-carrier-protein] dehydratase|tara:strand:+ start:7290 stop:7739 length:450 start_codon:yes stop_codon:yes gene_type:complete
MSAMSVQEIMDCLPHRYPFLLLDSVIECNHGDSIIAKKNVSINEPFFTGHFPGTPVFPGVLILEALAQASGVLVLSDPALRPEKKSLFLFVGVDDVRFKRPVVPGDQLILKSRISRMKRNLGLFECSAYVDDELAASGQLKCMFKELDD